MESSRVEAQMRSIRSVSSGKKRHLDHAVLSTDGKRRRAVTVNSRLNPMMDFALSTVFAI